MCHGCYVIKDTRAAQYVHIDFDMNAPRSWVIVGDTEQLPKQKLQGSLHLCPSYMFCNSFAGILKVCVSPADVPAMSGSGLLQNL